MRPRTPALLLVAFLLSGTPLAAQLDPDDEPLSLGPLGGSAVSVAVDPGDPDVVLVIKYTEGLYRSTDGGASTAPYGQGASPNIRELTPDPLDGNILYVLDGPQILQSTDFGATWSPLALVANEDLKDVAVATSGELLALDAFNVYHSDDGGATWGVSASTVPFGGTVFDVVEYAASDPSIAYYSANNGVFRSEDGGESFFDPGPFSTWTQALTVSPIDANTVFAGTPFNGVLRSTNGGLTFDVVGLNLTQGDNGEFFAWDPGGSRLWYALLDGVVYTEDLGATWSVTTGFPSNQPIPACMAFDTTGRRFLGTEGGGLNDQSGAGLYRMPAGAPAPWQHVGFLEVGVNETLIPEPGGRRVVGLGSGVYSAEPGGNTLVPTAYVFDIGTDTRALVADPTDPDRWLRGGVGAFFDNAQITELTQNATQFSNKYEVFGAGMVEDIEFDPGNPNRVLAGMYPAGFGNEAITASNDGGDTWTDVPGTVGWSTRDIAFDPLRPGRVVQLSDNGQWAVSLNSGQTWTELQPAWPTTGPSVFLAFDPFQVGTLYRGEQGGGLWRSENDGGTWTQLGVNVLPFSDLELHPDVPGMLWVSGDTGEILVSTDRGDTFDVAWTVHMGANGTGLSLDTSDGSLLVGTDDASTWELPNASPFVKLEGGSAGTGGAIPRHFPEGGLSRIGNGSFAFAGDRVVGGGPVFLAIGLQQLSIPVLGGTLFAGNVVIVLPAVADGTPGVAGDGSFSIPFGLPNDPTLVGASLVTQYVVFDTGAADPSDLVLSDGLRTRLLP